MRRAQPRSPRRYLALPPATAPGWKRRASPGPRQEAERRGGTAGTRQEQEGEGAAAAPMAPAAAGTAGSCSSPRPGAAVPLGCREAPGGLPAPVRAEAAAERRSESGGEKHPALGVAAPVVLECHTGTGAGRREWPPIYRVRPGTAATHHGEAAAGGKYHRNK